MTEEEREQILAAKAEVRKQMLSKRAFLIRKNKKEYDQRVCDALWNIIEERNCKVIHAYLPMGTEINTTPLIQRMLDAGKTVVSPKTLPKRKLQNLVLKSLDEIEKGVFGTTHPANTYEYTGNYDLIIVPGLAFDKDRYRVGYGGGYYDNFLVSQPNAYKPGIFYPVQEIEKVPRESHDIQLDTIITFKDIILLRDEDE